MMNDHLVSDARYCQWLRFVNSVAQNLATGASLPTGPSPTGPSNDRWANLSTLIHAKDRLRVAVCSPHPDDEALVGALPLRLQKEGGAEITNCAITLGSNHAARPRRLAELRASCRVLGFRLVVPNEPDGLDNVTAEEREKRPEAWQEKVASLAAIFSRVQPDLVLCPHREDVNRTHEGTHLLTMDALQLHLATPPQRRLMLAETEYWRPMSFPNLLLGVTPENEAILVMAIAEHGGEVARNPYHIQHPARLIDNVRRGSEVVGGLGGRRCNFTYGELYRISFLAGDPSLPLPVASEKRIIGLDERLTLASLAEGFSQ